MKLAESKRPLFRPLETDPCFCDSGVQFALCCGSKSETRKPPHGVRIIPEFLPLETCQQWVRYFEAQPRQALGVHGFNESRPSRLSQQSTSGRLSDKVKQGALSEQVKQTIQRAFLQQISQEMKRPVAWFENPQVLRYAPGGCYQPHADSDHFIARERIWQKIIDRDVSLLLYLNQEFEGGELNFRQYNYTYKPKTGDLIFFPSHGQYAHQALTVKSGIRYVIVSWAAFRDQPRVLNIRPDNCIDIDQGPGV